MHRKKKPNHTHITIGGNLINYPEDLGTNMAMPLLIKIFLNSVISTSRACFVSINLTNFYFMTSLKRPEFAKIKLSNILEEIIQKIQTPQQSHP